MKKSAHPPRPDRYSWMRRLRSRIVIAWHKVVTLEDTPHRIALGCAIGIFIAWLPVPGLQMLLSALAAKAFRANVLASLPWAWVTNPLTFVPIFFANYAVGMVFLPGDELLSRSDFQKIFDHIDEKLAHLSGWERWTTGMWQALVESFNLFNHVLWPILLGTVIVGLLVALALYTGIRRTVEALQRRRAARLAHWSSRREQTKVEKERKKTN